MIITKALLESQAEYPKQAALFATIFPGGVGVTEELCAQHSQSIDWVWAANNLLPPIATQQFDIQKESLLAAYLDQVEPHDDQTGPLYAAYEKRIVLLWAAYNEQLARAFGRLAQRVGGVLI